MDGQRPSLCEPRIQSICSWTTIRHRSPITDAFKRLNLVMSALFLTVWCILIYHTFIGNAHIASILIMKMWMWTCRNSEGTSSQQIHTQLFLNHYAVESKFHDETFKMRYMWQAESVQITLIPQLRITSNIVKYIPTYLL